MSTLIDFSCNASRCLFLMQEADVITVTLSFYRALVHDMVGKLHLTHVNVDIKVCLM